MRVNEGERERERHFPTHTEGKIKKDCRAIKIKKRMVIRVN